MARKTNKRTKELTRQQRLRRAKLKVQRVEVQLYAESGRDGHISDHLEKLERGTKGEWIKQAILEKMARETVGEDRGWMRKLLDRLDDLERRLLDRSHNFPAPPTNTHVLQPPRQMDRGNGFDDGDPIMLDVKADTQNNSSANFLNSLMNLQEH